jgi:hypothetical protein
MYEKTFFIYWESILMNQKFAGTAQAT